MKFSILSKSGQNQKDCARGYYTECAETQGLKSHVRFLLHHMVSHGEQKEEPFILDDVLVFLLLLVQFLHLL